MSQHDQSNKVTEAMELELGSAVPSHEPKAVAQSPHWLRRFLACNPFYLLSAAMLLFGVYKVSVDPQLAAREFSQLKFNFGSLQLYELLLVGTAILLARRRIWYDSTLLAALENMLLLVPFILINQAALIDPRTVGWMSVIAVGLVLVRFSALRRWFGELNLPPRALGLGLMILAVNVMWLWVYRHLQEERTPVWGMAHEMHEWSWLLILPAVLVLGNFLPDAKEVGRLLPQHRWLPFGFYALWITGTAVHLYSLTYAYDFILRWELIVPTLWVLAWTVAWRVPIWMPGLGAGLARGLRCLPAFIPLLAHDGGRGVLPVLAALNVAVYAAGWLLHRERGMSHHLAFASMVLLLAGMQWTAVPWNQVTVLCAGVGIYGVLWAWSSRHPKAGLLGSLLLATGMLIAGRTVNGVANIAIQSGLVFLLIHSVRWDDPAHAGARAVRNLVCVLWVLHSVLWTNWGAAWWAICIFSVLVVIACLVVRIFRGRWEFQILLTSAVLVGLAGPGLWLVGVLRTAPGGMLAILGSFLLFAAGTAAALTKHRWAPARH